MANNEGGSEKDEHGCIIGKEKWDPEQNKCVPISAADNPFAKISINQALAEKVALEKRIVEMQKTIDDLKSQLKAANDVLEAQTKAKLISEILPRSILTVEDLANKSLEELQHIRVTLDQARLPTYKNIRFGPIGVDEQTNEGLTVGDLSVVTAEKRKARRT